jgi:hypothetical protein
MLFTKSIFGKDFDELTIVDIESYFKEPKEENDKMEFKSYVFAKNGKNDLPEKEKAILRTLSLCALNG